ncbi:YciI family protein [Streptomyces sp. NPDC057494]|uniref:YciI family protein n=1 Tax=Streptomyces sp. NPDC057494 TaxID=3346148 RepID=UPI00369E3FBC
MFIVTVSYTAPLDEVNQWRRAHGEWLTDLVARQLLLMAGRRPEWVGGVYLVPGMPSEEIDRLLATDPYLLNGVAEHQVVEFTPLLVAPGLEELKARG